MVTWNDLFTQGTLIDYSVHLWRARLRITADDLGIGNTEEVKKAISLGCHRLAPSEAFDDINTIVRGWNKDIEDHSFCFPMLQGVRYVPDSEVEDLKEKINDRMKSFEIAVAKFLEKYDQIQNEMLPVIEEALTEAAKTPEAARVALERVRSEYPAKEKIATKFGLEWNFFTISIPTSKEAALAAKDSIPQVQRVVQSMVEQLRNELSEKVSNLINLAEKGKSGTSRSKDGIGEQSKQSALTVLDKVDRLNIFGDSVLSDQISNLRRLLKSDYTLDSVVTDLSQIKGNLESNIADAAAQAQKKLTGLGNRKIQL